MSPQQVFLSYCHRDNEPYGPQNRRWVEEFENALRESIGQRIGPGRIDLWRDVRRLSGNELFDDVISQQLDKSAILVTVLSQHYLSSAYCQKEFQAFGQRHIASGDLHVDRLSRIVKVFRRAIDRADLRRFVHDPALIPEVDGTVGYDLYYKDNLGVDRDVLLDPEQSGLYWQRADDIALAIKRMLDAAADQPATTDTKNTATATASTTSAAAPGAIAAVPVSTKQNSVYLARTSGDLKETRDTLQRELEDRGFRVLPEQQLPEDAESYTRVVQEALKNASLSVHMIGARYGLVPDGTDKSGVELQAELALAQRDDTLRSILWSPGNITLADLSEERQHQFVAELEQAAFQPHRAEFVRSSLEQLRALVIDRLRPPPVVAPPVVAPTVATGAADTSRSLYLVCDASDRADVKPLQTALTALGFAVVRPSAEGTVDELLEENKANLVSCDVVVVVWGKSREAWVRSKLREAQQAPGWGRTRPFAGKFIVVAPPDTAPKQDFDLPPGVLSVGGTGMIEQLQNLLRQ